MNIIVLENHEQVADNQFLLKGKKAKHVFSILKAKVGDELKVGVLNGGVGNATVTQISSESVELELTKLQPNHPMNQIDIVCALPRPQTLKKVLLLCGTMGVRNLYLVRANRVEKSFFHSSLLEPSNFTPFLIEGLSQGMHTRLPKVSVHDKFLPFFQDYLPTIVNSKTLKLVAHPGSGKTVVDFLTKKCEIILAIGPEGGWVPFEIENMQKTGFQSFWLSNSILRVEQAVNSALAQIELAHKLL